MNTRFSQQNYRAPVVREPIFRRVEEAFFRLFHRNPPASKLGTSVFWLCAVTVCLFVLAWLPGVFGEMFQSLATLTFLAAIFGSVPLVVHWLRWRMLWKLRNRLLVTYLLIGLAPVVLFGALAAIAAYVFSGQFANFAAAAEVSNELAELSTRNQALAVHVARLVEANIGRQGSQIANVALPPGDLPSADTNLKLGAFLDGKPLTLISLPAAMRMHVIQPPQWDKGPFRGLVLDHDQMFFRAIDSEQAGAHSVVTITSLPLNGTFLDSAARGLGKITLMPNTRLRVDAPSNELSSSEKESVRLVKDSDVAVTGDPSAEMVTGGTLAKRANLLDIPVNIPTLLEATDWRTGRTFAVVALVTSRPSLLYQRLFRQSMLMGTGWKIALLIAALIFGVLQLLALFMASRLSRTITKSVSELYQATSAVDAGQFEHRIVVTRNDQLAELSRSFNRMSASLERLLVEQKEKERMQSELAIAQEVQANLFPNIDIALPKLELHGNCRPARAVSGDYYDFLLFGELGVGLAIGDISGKGISAALLMATLHSAVRAYRFCSQEMMHNYGSAANGANGVTLGDNGAGQDGLADIFQSPGKILSLLNQHLYLSTQPERYATLFLAHYDATDNILRYCNGGHLPPLVLRADGSLERLDRGGTVVGLMEGMLYEEGRLQLAPGDLFIGYSDGVTEPENEFGDFGEERMIEMIRQNRHLPLSEICGRLMQALDDWIGAAEQPDDITLILARQR